MHINQNFIKLSKAIFGNQWEISAHKIDKNTPANDYLTWLTPEENTKFKKYHNSKRQIQWLFGRLCAKISTISFFKNIHHMDIKHQSIITRSTKSGRPYLHHNTNSTISLPDISISHSHDQVLALASSHVCGIDIQKITKKTTKVENRFCTEKDITNLTLLDKNKTYVQENTAMLTLLWTVKEAAIKALNHYHSIYFLDLSTIKITEHPDNCYVFSLKSNNTNHPKAKVVAELSNNYAIAICILQGNNYA